MSNREYRYSTIQAAYKCQRLYKYLYVDMLPEPGLRGADLSFGTAMHAAIEASLSGSSGLEMFNVFWESERTKERAYGRYNWEELKEQGEVFITRFERLHRHKIDPIHLEKVLESLIEGVRFKGTPDCIGRYDGKVSIIDFKTSGYPYPKERLKVGEQMPLYAYMAEQELGVKIEQLVYLVMVKGKDPRIQTLVLPIEDTNPRQTLDNILQVCRDLDKKKEEYEFTQNRSSCIIGTNKCPFYSKCHGED